MFEQMILDAIRKIVQEELAKIVEDDGVWKGALATRLTSVEDRLNRVEARGYTLEVETIDEDRLAEAVSTALDDKMDAIAERVANEIDLTSRMADFIKNEVTLSIDTY